VDDISGGFTYTGRGGVQAFKVLPLLSYRVYTDGRPDEVVRGADLVGTPVANFEKILAASSETAVFNGTCSAESGYVPVSAVSPGILFSEMEVEKSRKSSVRPPVLPPPGAEGAK
jgi:TldD protein